MSATQRFALAVALLVVGFALGWIEKGVHVAAGETRQARSDMAAMTRDVQRQADGLQLRLQNEQAASVALLIAQRGMRDAGQSLRLEIRHATFTSSSPTCPDPLDSPEFYRLYNAAAVGGTADVPAAAAGGVHP